MKSYFTFATLSHIFYCVPCHRALLKNPTLILCDEVTSSVDAFAERDIVDTLRRASEQRTTLTGRQLCRPVYPFPPSPSLLFNSLPFSSLLLVFSSLLFSSFSIFTHPQHVLATLNHHQSTVRDKIIFFPIFSSHSHSFHPLDLLFIASTPLLLIHPFHLCSL